MLTSHTETEQLLQNKGTIVHANTFTWKFPNLTDQPDQVSFFEELKLYFLLLKIFSMQVWRLE